MMERTPCFLCGRGAEIVIVFLFFMISSTITTALRIYVRTSLVKIFGYEDWTSLLGWLLFMCYGSFIITAAYCGLGQYTDKLPLSDLSLAFKWWWIAELFNVLAFTIVKLSIALQLLRYVVEPVHRYIIITVTTILQLFSIAIFFLYVFQCKPLSFYWTQIQGTTGGTCIKFENIEYSRYAYTSLIGVADFTMAAIPWLMIRKLQLNLRTRIVVTTILSLGSVAFIATIIRVPYIHILGDSAKILYNATDVISCSCAEIGLSLMASSAITLKPLFNDFLERGRLRRSQIFRSDELGSSPFRTMSATLTSEFTNGNLSLKTYETTITAGEVYRA